MGIVPIWGFQMVTAIALSFLFRLNKALVLIAANISVPPVIPAIIFLSHFTGKIWMGKNAQTISFSTSLSLDVIHNNFLQYLYGAVTLSVVAGIVFGGLTYITLKLSKQKRD